MIALYLLGVGFAWLARNRPPTNRRRRDPSRWPEPPAGFELRPDGACALYVAENAGRTRRARAALDAWEAWDRALVTGSTASGRGATAVVDGAIRRARGGLKAMRRGGRLARALARPLPVRAPPRGHAGGVGEARARGVPTRGPGRPDRRGPGLGPVARGAMAFEEIEGAEDLARRVRSRRRDARGSRRAIAPCARCTIAAFSIPISISATSCCAPRAGDPPEAFVIDFDRATFAAGPLPFARAPGRTAPARALVRQAHGGAGPAGPRHGGPLVHAYAGGRCRRSRAGCAVGRRRAGSRSPCTGSDGDETTP